jgi:hypothetical protein
MDLDLRLQRIYDRVELVSGIGDPASGRMCVMSFAACLAGEGHTDSPPGASSLIRSFAIPLNDTMPHDARQRLKPFAPRIIGTRDGLDTARTEVLRHALTEEILPRIAAHRAPPAGGAPTRRNTGRFARLLARLRGREEAERRIERLLERIGNTARRANSGGQLAGELVQLISLCARAAPNAREEAWYWNEAIGLLDRLCEVGAPQPQRIPRVRMDRVEWLERTLGTASVHGTSIMRARIDAEPKYAPLDPLHR